ncbi:MAG: asparagine synthase C-terminal domain-containing protein, partial [Alphaproteobacteria bacterium]|nr:asparagine synthase C-terminal domain-containing protein [Alphaproteobacteria bacterium]
YFYTDKTIDFDAFIDAYYLKWQRLIPNTLLKDLLTPIWDEVKHVWTRDVFLDVMKPIKKHELTPDACLNASLYLEAKTFLHGLLVVEDKLSMAHGLETRVPFLDNDLVDFSMQIPMHLKIQNQHEKVDENDLISKLNANSSGKHVLRKTLAKHLDKKVTENKKQGFSSPDASWFRGDSIEYVQKELSTVSNMFDQTIVNKIFTEHASGKKNNRLAIWSLLYLNRIMQK